jgi:hypothetical protein
VVTGIFIPIAWLNAPMKRANTKNRMKPTKIPRITAATILSASGLGSFSAIKSLSDLGIYSNWHYLNNGHEKGMKRKRFLIPFLISVYSENNPISAHCNKILIIIRVVSISPTSRDSKSLLKS